MTAADVLLVEDSPGDAMIVKHIFAKQNPSHRLSIVSDGEEALEFLFAEGRYADRNINDPPRLVLLDLKLPKVDGLEVLGKVKKDGRTQTIPVVMLTSSQHSSDLQACYSNGANGYLVKPLDFKTFDKLMADVTHYWLGVNKWIR